jgi:hypothetical protein
MYRTTFIYVLSITFSLLTFAGCGGGKSSTMSQDERLKAAKLSGPVMGNYEGTIEDLKLVQSDLPTGYSFTDKLTCPQSQVKLMYERPEMFSALPKIAAKDFQTVRGANGEEGSILYIQFETTISDGQSGFIGGMIWGTSKRVKGPSDEHPEDYLTVSKTLVIWCLKSDNPVKKISQDKVRLTIDEG